jgi:hypothetical protein
MSARWADLVDLGEMSTWPAEVVDAVKDLTEDVQRTSNVSELQLPDGADEQLRALLNGTRFLAFHASRLLDHEVAMIQQRGLRPFGRDLFDDKIQTAFAHGALTADERDALLAGHMRAPDAPQQLGIRDNQVCVILGRSAFDEDARAVRPLLTMWGGEGISFAGGTAHLEPVLRRLGKPSIVAVAVPIAASRRQQYYAPGLDKLLVGAALGLPAHGSVHHEETIPETDIIGIWQPGNPEYDRHVHLPSD